MTSRIVRYSLILFSVSGILCPIVSDIDRLVKGGFYFSGWNCYDENEVKTESLMTKADVMQYLRISHDTLHRLMRSGAFPYMKLERKVLFRKDDIDRFLESKLVKSK
jgi:excisionase family DNA binding protein